MAKIRSTRVRVAILAFPEVTASVLYGLYDILRRPGATGASSSTADPDHHRCNRWRCRASTVRSRPPTACASARSSRCTICAAPDIVCVPEVAIPPGEPLDGFAEEAAWLARCHAAGATIATACSGAMLLAQTGLLDGGDATTHWAYCDTLRARHPRVRVHPQRALVTTGEGQRLVMAGGGTTWLDLAIYLVSSFRRPRGRDADRRINLIEWHDIGQQPFARLARSRQSTTPDRALPDVDRAPNYHEPAPVGGDGAAVRTAGALVQARFQQATGMAPLEYVHTLRLEEAKQMLETGMRRSKRSPTRWATRMPASSAVVPARGLADAGAVPQALARRRAGCRSACQDQHSAAPAAPACAPRVATTRRRARTSP